MIGHAAVWGPMFLMGLLSLSDVLNPVTSVYIEHGLSNLMIPASIYSAYLLYQVAADGPADDSDPQWPGWAKLGTYIIVQGALLGVQVTHGASAMYYLNEGRSKWADSLLLPSFVYALKWREHNPRHHNDYYGGYYH